MYYCIKTRIFFAISSKTPIYFSEKFYKVLTGSGAPSRQFQTAWPWVYMLASLGEITDWGFKKKTNIYIYPCRCIFQSSEILGDIWTIHVLETCVWFLFVWTHLSLIWRSLLPGILIRFWLLSVLWIQIVSFQISFLFSCVIFIIN